MWEDLMIEFLTGATILVVKDLNITDGLGLHFKNVFNRFL